MSGIQFPACRFQQGSGISGSQFFNNFSQCLGNGNGIFALVSRQPSVPAAQGQSVWFPYCGNRMEIGWVISAVRSGAAQPGTAESPFVP